MPNAKNTELIYFCINKVIKQFLPRVNVRCSWSVCPSLHLRQAAMWTVGAARDETGGAPDYTLGDKRQSWKEEPFVSRKVYWNETRLMHLRAFHRAALITNAVSELQQDFPLPLTRMFSISCGKNESQQWQEEANLNTHSEMSVCWVSLGVHFTFLFSPFCWILTDSHFCLLSEWRESWKEPWGTRIRSYLVSTSFPWLPRLLYLSINPLSFVFPWFLSTPFLYAPLSKCISQFANCYLSAPVSWRSSPSSHNTHKFSTVSSPKTLVMGKYRGSWFCTDWGLHFGVCLFWKLRYIS